MAGFPLEVRPALPAAHSLLSASASARRTSACASAVDISNTTASGAALRPASASASASSCASAAASAFAVAAAGDDASTGATHGGHLEPSICAPQSASIVCARIEKLLLDFLESLADPLAREFPRFDVISRRQQPQLLNGALCLSTARTERVTLSPAPSCNPKRYARMWEVLSFVHKLLRSDPPKSMTQREIYYLMPGKFRTQAECNQVILDVAGLLRVDRASLGLFSSAKGFFGGSVSVCSGADGAAAGATWVDCRTLVRESNGVSICPAIALGQRTDAREFGGVAGAGARCCGYTFRSHSARCILVVEKDGIYNRLLQDRYFDKYPCVLVTGRGFPDLATRALVSALRTQLQLPVFGLCDWNPFGLALLLSYKIGSVTGGAEASRYAVPSMAWLGLRAAQIDRLQRKEGIELSSKPFSPVDRRKVQSMLRNNQFLGETQNAEWRQELEAMQERGIKVDLEAVLELERGFEIFSEEVVQQELLSENAIA